VRDYVFPTTALVIFIFDAFKEELLRNVVGNLHRSYLASKRKIYLIYVNPHPRHRPIYIIENTGFLRKKKIFNFAEWINYYRESPFPVVVYESREHAQIMP
jgi:hypothetical protein